MELQLIVIFKINSGHLSHQLHLDVGFTSSKFVQNSAKKLRNGFFPESLSQNVKSKVWCEILAEMSYLEKTAGRNILGRNIQAETS